MIQAITSWLEIDTKAFTHNIEYIQQQIGLCGTIGLMVKSNAYGHGMREVALLAQQMPKIDYIITFLVSQAVQIRAWGVTKPILAVGCFFDGDPAHVVEHAIEMMVADYEVLDQLHRAACAAQKKVSIHLKVDTGLSRFGFLPNEIEHVVAYVHALPCLQIVGIASHCAEVMHTDAQHVHHQKMTLRKIMQKCAARGVTFPLYHIDKSETLSGEAYQERAMVRIGAAAYGLCRNNNNVKQILSWKTKIIQLRHLPAGVSVGYGRTFTTQRPTTIALLPVGYFDGYKIVPGAGAQVLVQSSRSGNKLAQRAPVIGVVAMNVTTIDVTDTIGVAVGDTVEILGNHDGIRVHDVAAYGGIVNLREVAARINPLLPRIIVPDSELLNTDTAVYFPVHV